MRTVQEFPNCGVKSGNARGTCTCLFLFQLSRVGGATTGEPPPNHALKACLFFFQANVSADEIQGERAGPEGQVHTAAGHRGRGRLPLQVSQQVTDRYTRAL